MYSTRDQIQAVLQHLTSDPGAVQKAIEDAERSLRAGRPLGGTGGSASTLYAFALLADPDPHADRSIRVRRADDPRQRLDLSVREAEDLIEALRKRVEFEKFKAAAGKGRWNRER